MANIEEGTYSIVGVDGGKGICAATVGGYRGQNLLDAAGYKDGASMYTAVNYHSVTQKMNLVRMRDGSWRIIVDLTGKNWDTNDSNPKAGDNVKQWTWQDGHVVDQTWTFVETGETATCNGVSYDVYYIKLANANLYAGRSPLKDVGSDYKKIMTDVRLSATPVKWLLEPWPDFVPGGTYSLHPYSMIGQGRNMNLSGGISNGARLYSKASVPDTESSRFIIEDAQVDGYDDIYLVRYLEAPLYMGASSFDATDDSPVQMTRRFQMNNWQLWNVELTGGYYDGPNGYKVPIVRLNSFIHTNPTDRDYQYVLTAYEVSNKKLYARLAKDRKGGSETDQQLFLLKPASIIDKNLPTVTNMGIATGLRNPAYTNLAYRGADGTLSQTVYPTWECPETWARDNPNSFEWRYRILYHGSFSGKTWYDVDGNAYDGGNLDFWDDDSSGWMPAPCTIKSKRAWITEGVDVSFMPDGERDEAGDIITRGYDKAMVAFEVRACGVGERDKMRGAIATKICYVIWWPTIEWGTVGVTPDGLHMDYTTDYVTEPTTVKILGIYDQSGDVICKGYDATDQTRYLSSTFWATEQSWHSLFIPMSALSKVPAAGSSITVRWKTGTSSYRTMGDADEYSEATLTVAETAGTKLNVTSESSDAETLLVSFDDLGLTKVWFTCDGMVEADKVSSSGGRTTYSVSYPIGKDYDVVVASAENADPTPGHTRRWGVSTLHMSKSGMPPFHMWNWEGCYAKLRYTDDPLGFEVSNTLTPTYDRVKLNSRRRETVTYGTVVSSEFSAEGYLLDVDTTDEEALRNLLDVHYALYRSPRGHWAKVAIVGMTLTRRKSWTHVTVDMVEVEQ